MNTPATSTTEFLSASARRALVLDRLLAADRLPSPPAVAMQIVRETSDPEVTVARVAELLRQDPAICALVLKAINSCVYGLSEQVTSVNRAVLLLGLNAVRGVVLAVSLSAMQLPGVPDAAYRDFWQSAVSGAVIARELALRLKVPTAESDMLAGLLRDIGQLLLLQAYPDESERFARGMAERPYREWCDHESQVFGVDHADVSAELFRKWNLPESLVHPIRFHHRPAELTVGTPELRARCERLGFVDALTNLDVIARHPADVDALLGVAFRRYHLGQAELVEFLHRVVVPKVEAFTALLNVDAGSCPNYAVVLARGSTELFKLTVQSGPVGGWSTIRPLAPSAADPRTTAVCPPPADLLLPEFQPEFLSSFPATGCRLDGYSLRRVIGRGAMGVVFEGYEPSLARPVAIKMLRPELDHDESRLRFLREARSVAAIRHESVVAVYAVKDTGPYAYINMELVDGESLEERIDRDPPVGTAEAIALAVQVASGLAAAHARRIVHRDVKPANILLDRATGQAKLTDFGLARADADSRLTVHGHLLGTPLYMSPEQTAGQPVGPRSDLFSLGGVLYAAVTGHPPFEAASLFQVMKRICEDTPVPPRQLRPQLPAWFEAVILKLLAKREADRYQSADEVIAALRHSDAGLPPVTAPRSG